MVYKSKSEHREFVAEYEAPTCSAFSKGRKIASIDTFKTHKKYLKQIYKSSKD